MYSKHIKHGFNGKIYNNNIYLYTDGMVFILLVYNQLNEIQTTCKFNELKPSVQMNKPYGINQKRNKNNKNV